MPESDWRNFNVDEAIDYAKERLRLNALVSRGGVGSIMATHHAPVRTATADCACGGHTEPPQPAPRRRAVYDAAALTEIADGLAAAGRELSELNAAFARRKAQATADAARSSLAAHGRAAVDRLRSGPIATMNTRAAELHGRKPTGPAPVRSALPAGFTADAGFATPASINARTKEFWANRKSA